MQWIKSIPLLLFVFIAYNLIAVGGPEQLNQVLLQTTLLSGVSWSFTVSDLLLALGIIALCVEMIKATRSSNASILDHMLSMLLFVAFLVEFIAYSLAATSTFFLMMLMSFVDVLAGFTVTIAAARRDVGYNE
ncbi:hypothetical protein LX59_02591 [Azomonas agilis]|uniref:Transmembrane protein n=1 Tax=Azomonas agilis TaxID=116849 RepID=A0A562I0Y9_9GAMM|nr:hypothetical protein [Azomonas agilis]TWH64384.1 hypothetical protein LX59_02591 [Azomonas agilis]